MKIYKISHKFNIVYHGTDQESANDIINNGIDSSKFLGGYFGFAFYTTPYPNLAKSNYADFSEDNDGVVLEFSINPDAKILDLRDPDDFNEYKLTNHPRYYNTLEGSLRIYNEFGIDAIYDRSNDSVMIFNPKILKFNGIYENI